MMIMRILYFTLFLVFIYSCETEFDPDIPDTAPEIVVEGIIEAGDRPSPPYVILTRSIPFFTTVSQDALDDIFIHGATITVKEGTNEVSLTEICLEDLSAEQQAQAANLFGVDLSQLGVNFCVYVDLSFSMLGASEKSYDLRIEVEGKVLTATTTIPPQVGLDNLFFTEPPGEPNDSLMELNATISDPAGTPNFYRFFTQVNDEPLYPGFPSVGDDLLFDGQSLTFPIPKAASRETDFADIDIETFGLFVRGDSVLVKQATIDEAHFRFWNTLEFNATNQGPFSTYTLIETNINGGLGLWGGYNANYYELVVPEE